MIYYKTKPQDDPYYDLWHSPEWLFPFENKDKLIFPVILTVEPVNICQNTCIYCNMRLMDRETGFMSRHIMERIIGEAAHYGASIRFGGFGEPLVHKEIKELVEACKTNKIRTTIFTNASLLNEDMMRSFCKSGLDEIRFSTSGLSATAHNEIRRNSDWNKDFRQKVIMANRIKKEMGCEKPYLAVFPCVFDYDSDEFKLNVDRYVKDFLIYVDKIDIDLIDLSRVRHLEEIKPYYPKTIIKEVYKPCVALYHKMLIHWNGDLFACDVVYNFDEAYYCGNLNDEHISIYDMYHSEKVNRLRERTEAFRHRDLPLCRDCYQTTYKYEDLKKRK